MKSLRLTDLCRFAHSLIFYLTINSAEIRREMGDIFIIHNSSFIIALDLPITNARSGTVVTAPTRKRVQPTDFFCSLVSLSPRSRAVPAPRAALVPAMRASSGMDKRVSFMMDSCYGKGCNGAEL